MKALPTGTKSILIGVHQFIYHPITVLIAWRKIYQSWPTWRELVCIIIHDWGYWGKEKMDDENGECHPEFGAKIAHWLFDRPRWVIWDKKPEKGWYVRNEKYYNFCLYHSRHYARKYNVEPSLLCWPDKLSIIYDPWWLYLPRAWASGELKEYRRNASDSGFIHETKKHREWFYWIQERLSTLAKEKRGDAVDYANPSRKV